MIRGLFVITWLLVGLTVFGQQAEKRPTRNQEDLSKVSSKTQRVENHSINKTSRSGEVKRSSSINGTVGGTVNPNTDYSKIERPVNQQRPAESQTGDMNRTVGAPPKRD